MKSDYHKEWYLKNKDRVKKQHQEYYFQNKEDINQRQAEYRKDNRNKIRDDAKLQYIKNKDVVLKTHKEYREKTGYDKKYYIKNKERINKNKYVRKKLKLKTDLNYRLLENYRRRLNLAFSEKSLKKSISTKELVGCTAEELKIY